MIRLTVKEDARRTEALLRAVKALSETRVEVGLPDSAGARLRRILAIQEHGSPLMRIPPRPVVAPALARPEVRREMAEALRSAAEAAFAGEEAGVSAGFEAAGRAGADGIRAYIDAVVSPPNAPVTVSGGWVYNRAARKGVRIPGKGFNKPLFRTGELYGAFSWEVKRNE